jgi:amino acid adenylation domain-containing protein
MLDHLVLRSAARWPDNLAVHAPSGDLTYAELDAMANRIARLLQAGGVRAGDRVAIWLPKSGEAVAAMQAALRLGAAYVPIDVLSPPARARTVMEDCAVRAVVTRAESASSVFASYAGEKPYVLAAEDLRTALESTSAEPVERPAMGPNDLAYILYTSGSTGRPKGVCITHRNALAFVEWAVDALGVTETDRFSNHAPFHFDLSVLDLYAAFSVGGAVCLVPEGAAYAAEHLVKFLHGEKITVWYSVPSALTLMMEHGGLLERGSGSLRALLFAGEAFPMKHLRRIREALPGVAMWNLYGPTETNVCTAYRVEHIAPTADAISIGQAVSGDRVWIRAAGGDEAAPGEEGELMVEGPTVFPGYWGQPRRDDSPYATGDLVRAGANGELHFLGRRDHMVKVRGHRIELGEIEAAVLAHPSARNAAAVVIGEGLAARIVVFLAVGQDRAPSLLDVKRLCSERLPRYMIPDDAVSMAELPRNANGKIDRRALALTVKPQ